jgi:hypothetical protein
VVRHRQVLVCPECRSLHGDDGLDRCADCGSASLVRRLGETVCRSCGAADQVVEADASLAPAASDGARQRLVGGVSDALDRLFPRD